MKFLHTHALLWWLADDSQLGRQARELVEDPGNNVLVSMVSLWKSPRRPASESCKPNLRRSRTLFSKRDLPC